MPENLKRRESDLHPEMEGELHAKHHEFVTLLIEKETQRIKFREAVIEKTTASLIWSAIVFVGVAIWKYVTTVGKL